MPRWTYDERTANVLDEGGAVVAYGVSPEDGPLIARTPELLEFARRVVAAVPMGDASRSCGCLGCTARLMLAEMDRAMVRPAEERIG